MKNELKQELTRRLCACNNGGLVLVMYDIYFGFSDDVKNALMSEDREALTALSTVLILQEAFFHSALLT